MLADFATRLRELRKSKKMRQIDLAKQFGVAQTTIANYEQHSRFPDEDTLGVIASYFDVSLDYLLGRTDVNLLPAVAAVNQSDAYELIPLARTFLELLLRGKKHDAYNTIIESVKRGMPVRTIYSTVFEPTLKEVGRLWEINDIDVAAEHYFSAATESLMGQLYPFLTRSTDRLGSMVAVAVGGELHQIGLRMVTDTLEEEGWECFYLGTNAPTSDIFQAVIDRDADILAISATMEFGVDVVANTIRHIRSRHAERASKPLYIITGGRAFRGDANLWRHVGADGFAQNAADAIHLASNLTSTS
jgi:MerR family transcriptional regulator, light-induced transcriptional regulator